jgi:hypothetical protein
VKKSCRLAATKDPAAGIFPFFRHESGDLTVYNTFNGTIK